VFAIISSELHVRSSPIFVHVILPVFVGDVMFAHKPRLLDVAAQLMRREYAAFGLAINCAMNYKLL